MGVATAPAIRYAVSIQDDILYEISKSLIMSRIAGNSMVSPYIVIRIVDPRIASVIHAEVLISLEVSSNPVLFFGRLIGVVVAVGSHSELYYREPAYLLLYLNHYNPSQSLTIDVNAFLFVSILPSNLFLELSTCFMKVPRQVSHLIVYAYI
jgi:hypothetical protein